MEMKTTAGKQGFVFSSLVLLVLGSVAVKLLHLSPLANNVVVLSTAVLMAVLVLLFYMGLRREVKLVWEVFAVPVVLFVILLVLLMPDIGHFTFGLFDRPW
jgi:caa(3)-type oxidase subunit IV